MFLKTDVSSWYDSHNSSISMFKVLFRNKINNDELSEIKDTMELLNKLECSDNLNTADLTLLYNTIKITQHFGLIRRISKHIPANSLPDVKKMPISEFSEKRQKLMKFGNVLTKKGVRLINGLYNTPLQNYENSWSMIIDLEERDIISEGETMKTFIENLEKLDLPLAVKALNEEAVHHPRPTKPKYEEAVKHPKPTKPRSQATTSRPNSKRPNKTESRDEPKPKITRVQSEPSPEITHQEYVQLKFVVSKHWNYGSINMLKVLLRQFVSQVGQAELQNARDVMGLLRLLEGVGVVNRSNPAIIFEAVKICHLEGVESEIKKNLSYIRKFYPKKCENTHIFPLSSKTYQIWQNIENVSC
ncbi:uncharacterized protein LOC117112676 isoform X1 [Anneissia japonica]|uniref:uncharacterized protein LOC117112676 isoform X1 n=1 Tax=Anneissia japonica TaxID=1529436 RepID=UPI0014256ED5|nr:uncharacterized protein LOC117112676 isoform X1 [Anneissia japonica]